MFVAIKLQRASHSANILIIKLAAPYDHHHPCLTNRRALHRGAGQNNKVHARDCLTLVDATVINVP